MKHLTALTYLLLLFLCSTTLIQAQIFEDYQAFTSNNGIITAVKFSPSGQYFANSNAKGWILIRTAHGKRSNIPQLLRKHIGQVPHLSFDRQEKHLVSTGRDGTLKVWALENDSLLLDLKATGNNNPYFTFAYFVQNDQAIIYGGLDGKLQMIHPFEAGAKPEVITTSSEPILTGDLSKDGRYLIWGSKTRVRVVDIEEKKTRHIIETCPKAIRHIQYNATSDLMGCLCSDGQLSLWDLKSQKAVQTWQVSNVRAITQMAFSPDGQYLVVGDGQSKPKVWDLTSFQPTSVLTGHTKPVGVIDFSPDSRYIVTGSLDQTVKMYQWRKVFPNEEIPIPAPPSIPKPKQATIPPPIVEPTLDEIKLKYTSRNIPDSLGVRKVKTGKRMIITGEELIISLWDSEEIDGDTISLYLNGDWILREFPLQRRKKKLKVRINKNADNYMILYAHNEGSRPPNTAAVKVSDGRNEKRISLSSNMKTCDAVNFNFK